MTTTGESFESVVDEYRQLSKAMLGEEVHEGYPLDARLHPGVTQPYDASGPPYQSPFVLTEANVKAYARNIGDDNPLYTDPEYAKTGPYGCLVAPGPALLLSRNSMWHGARVERPGGWPLANFHSGSAWEFFDVLRVGTGFKTSSTAREMIEKPGSRGNLFLFVTDVYYWDMRGDLLGKNYGTLIMIPREEMGTSRTMSVDRLGERMLYDRQAATYDKEKVEEIIDLMANSRPRGKEILYWEDVEVGDKLTPVALPPFTDQDMGAANVLPTGMRAYNFEAGHHLRKQGIHGAYGHPHPLTRWPWGGGDEHGDALMAAYRGIPLPFDHGRHRSQIAQQLMSNWMGDYGFIRRLQMALRRPMYYSDTSTYTGEVVKKFTEVQGGEEGKGAAPGKSTYYAVGIRYECRNQDDLLQVQGTSAVYLPSREGGNVELPIPHPARPPFVPYETFYRDWF